MPMPRNPERIPYVMYLIQSIWRKHPDMRLMQLLENVSDGDCCMYHMEDDALVSRLIEQYLDEEDRAWYNERAGNKREEG
jgi:uncharacterized protein YihD (DUF1040 family)